MSIGVRVRKSPYFDATIRHGARAFTVYNHMYMPTSYTDPVTEYWSLVNDVTIWDVACQRQIEISGPDALEFVQYLTPRDVAKCKVGRCQYLVLTDEDGGIVNDAVLLRLEQQKFWLSPGDGDALLWVRGIAVNRELDVSITEPEVFPLQLQGPKSPAVASELLGQRAVQLPYYALTDCDLDHIPLLISRTGWSGELGYELYLRDRRYGDELWERVIAAGQAFRITATAPSTIRSIEGRLFSYRSDITRADNPYVLAMPRLVDLDKKDDFIGRPALEKIRAQGAGRQLVGIEISGPAIDDANEEYWPVMNKGKAVGHITRCVHSPRLEMNIGFANVSIEHAAMGAKLVAVTPSGERNVTVCESPWFPPQRSIPDRKLTRA